MKKSSWGASPLKLLVGLVAAVSVFGVAATSLSSAAPIYTGWSAPVNLGPVVNSTAAEMGPALSPDGLSLYISVTRQPGSVGGPDEMESVNHGTIQLAAGFAPELFYLCLPPRRPPLYCSLRVRSRP